MSVFGNPLGLLALLSLPAVVVLHLYRRRHDELPVSALFLWTDAETADSAGRVRHPLRRTPSFWLELAAALVASLLVAGFDPLPREDAAHLVVVLDDSASMQAGEGDGDSPRGRAIARVEDLLDDHGPRTRVTLVASGARPRLLCGPGGLAGEARAALDAWRPASPSHDLAPALALGRELAGEGELLLLTDRLPDDLVLDAATRIEALGTPRGNLALLSPERAPVDAETDRVRCRVRSFDDRPRDAELRLTAAGTELLRRPVSLPPGGSASLDLEVPASTPALTVSITPDALALDDRVVLHPPWRRPVRVGWALEEGLPGRLGLDRLTRVVPDVVPVAREADLVLAHETAPPPAWSLVLPRDGDPAEALIGPFLIATRHPLLEGVTLDGVLWTRAEGEPPDGLPLVSAGDRALLAEVVRDEARRYTLDLLPARSTLQRSPDWPILLANLIELRRAELPGPGAVNLVAGEPFTASADAPTDWALTGPDGERTLVDARRLVLDDLPVHGDYHLRAVDGPEVRFAVNLVDAAESDLRGAGTGTRAPDGSAGLATLAGAGSVSETLLLVLLACLAAADWWWLGRGPRP